MVGEARPRGLHWARVGDEGFAQSRRIAVRSISKPDCAPQGHTFDDLLAVVARSLRCAAVGGGQAQGTTAARFGRAAQRGDDGQANNFPLRSSWCRSLGLDGVQRRLPVPATQRARWVLLGVPSHALQDLEHGRACAQASAADDALGCVGSHVATRPNCVADFRGAWSKSRHLLGCDWLHCVDLGIAADWIDVSQSFLFGATLLPFSGNVYKRFTAKPVRQQDGRPHTEYAGIHVTDTESYVLRCRVSWLRAKLAEADAMDRCVTPATDSLASCYDCLSQHAPFAEERLATHCRKFCALKEALEARRLDIFRVKPKLHFFQEM